MARKRAAGAGEGALVTVLGCEVVYVETGLAACFVPLQPTAGAVHARRTAIRSRIHRMLDPEALFQSKCVPDGEALPVVVEVGIDVVIAAPILDPLGPLLELVL